MLNEEIQYKVGDLVQNSFGDLFLILRLETIKAKSGKATRYTILAYCNGLTYTSLLEKDWFSFLC